MAFLSDRGTTALTTGGYIHIILPNAGSPTGYDSFRISVTALHAALQAQVTSNANSITAVDARLTVVENSQGIASYEGVTGSQTFSQPAYSFIKELDVLNKTGASGTLRIGTTSGGDEILSEQTIGAGAMSNFVLGSEAINNLATSRTIYITITGTLYINLFYRENANFV